MSTIILQAIRNHHSNWSSDPVTRTRHSCYLGQRVAAPLTLRGGMWGCDTTTKPMAPVRMTGSSNDWMTCSNDWFEWPVMLYYEYTMISIYIWINIYKYTYVYIYIYTIEQLYVYFSLKHTTQYVYNIYVICILFLVCHCAKHTTLFGLLLFSCGWILQHRQDDVLRQKKSVTCLVDPRIGKRRRQSFSSRFERAPTSHDAALTAPIHLASSSVSTLELATWRSV